MLRDASGRLIGTLKKVSGGVVLYSPTGAVLGGWNAASQKIRDANGKVVGTGPVEQLAVLLKKE
jgi:hypothetical protein